jgi:homoserine dehydrogenase
LALHLEELYALQQENGVSLLYEGAVCASIPIIRTLEEYFDNEELKKVSGIFNGTTNYILTKTIKEKLTYQQALSSAQEKGFAETDPTSDVEAYDPKYKSVILALHAFGIIINPEAVLNIGITTLHAHDIQYASEKNYKIKLTPVIRRVDENRISVFVTPQYVKESEHLFNVENEFNGVVLEGLFSGEQFLQGKGAGSYPTGAAVLSDISALSHGYKYEYKKHQQPHPIQFTNDVLIHVYLRYNTVLDLEKIEFENIREKYNGADYNYIIGTINLQTLVDKKEYIRNNGLFVALVSDVVEIPTEIKSRNKQTIKIKN